MGLKYSLEANNSGGGHGQNLATFVRGPLRECSSIGSGASGLPHYCTPLVSISALIGLLAVWKHNKPKTKTLYLGISLSIINKTKKSVQNGEIPKYKR